MSPEILDAIIYNFETKLDKNSEKLNMDGIIISQGTQRIQKLFHGTIPTNNVRSLGKAVLGMCIGIAMDQKLMINGSPLTLDTLIWPLFQNKVELSNAKNLGYLNKLTLRHLMTHTMGYGVGLLFSKEIEDIGEYNLIEYVFNYDIVHEPGTHFVYSNVGPYIISALIQNEFGITLSDWVNELLFKKIGIECFSWKKYGDYCAGCTGLELSLVDLHKIAEILVNDGFYLEQQIVPANWIEQMRTPQVYTPSMYDANRAFPKYAYGFYMYLCENGIFYCDGTDGQYIIMFPKQKIAISTMGHQKDMKPIGECFRPLLNFLNE